MNKTEAKIRHNVLPVIAALIWGTAFVAQDAAGRIVSPFTVNTVRSVLSCTALGLGLFVYYLLAGRKKEAKKTPEQKRAERKSLIIGGLCCGAILSAAQTLQQFGIGGADAEATGTSPGKAGFITALYIVIVPILGIFFKKKTPLRVWVSLFIAVVGFYLLCITDTLTVELSDLLVFACAIIFSLHILAVDHFTKTVDGVKLSCAQFIVCSVVSGILMFVFEKPSFAVISQAALPLLYLGIFSSGIAYTLQIVSQKGANPTVVTLLLSLESVFAVISATILSGERLTVKEYLGCALIFAAVILTQLPERKKKQ